MDDTPILDAPWPPDLDPAAVPFHARTVTILRRMGYFNDPTLFDTLTEAEVLSWTNAGPRTVADIRDTGNAAIGRHHERIALLPQLRTALAAVAGEPWARHIWHRDPRFAEYLPHVDATVYEIATTGTEDDQWMLCCNLDGLRAGIGAQAARSLGTAVAEYVEEISGQHGQRLEVLLARTGLGGQDPITGVEAARRLGVSNQRSIRSLGSCAAAWSGGDPGPGCGCRRWGRPNGVDGRTSTPVRGWRRRGGSLAQHHQRNSPKRCNDPLKSQGIWAAWSRCSLAHVCLHGRAFSRLNPQGQDGLEGLRLVVMERPRIEFYSAGDGTRIAWSVHGVGYPLVRVGTFMTHLSWDWDSPIWAHWNTDLGSRFSYIRYDERGCGSSGRNPPEVSVEAWLGDLHGVIEASGFDRVALLGTSHAAAVAVAYADLHPERVSHIVSLGGYAAGGLSPSSPPDMVERSLAFIEALRVFWEDPDDFFRGIWEHLLIPGASAEDVTAMELLMRRSSSGEMAARIFELRDEMDVRGIAPRVATPTLLAHARNDRMVPFDKAVELASLLPNASLVTLECESHLPLRGPAWDSFVTEMTGFIYQAPGPEGHSIADPLTPREREVLSLVAEGSSNKDIGEHLAMSSRTVERHLTNIYRKLGLSGRAARAAAAARLHEL